MWWWFTQVFSQDAVTNRNFMSSVWLMWLGIGWGKSQWIWAPSRGHHWLGWVEIEGQVKTCRVPLSALPEEVGAEREPLTVRIGWKEEKRTGPSIFRNRFGIVWDLWVSEVRVIEVDLWWGFRGPLPTPVSLELGELTLSCLENGENNRTSL